MKKHHSGKLPLQLCAGGLLLTLVMNITACVSRNKAPELSPVEQGIAYLESLEQKDPSEVESIRKGIYERKLAAQRDQLVQQLMTEMDDPWGMFRDYCIMGDSRAVGFWYHKFLDKGRCIADGGHTIRDITANMDRLVEMAPGTVYLCYGLNDSSIGYWDSADAYVGEYMQIIREIQTRLPDTKIVVSSILPARDPAFERSTKWRRIPEWSAALEKACQENGVTFANCDVLYEDYPNLWDPDGIHFRKEFYPHWARYLLVATLMEG